MPAFSRNSGSAVLALSCPRDSAGWLVLTREIALCGSVPLPSFWRSNVRRLARVEWWAAQRPRRVHAGPPCRPNQPDGRRKSGRR